MQPGQRLNRLHASMAVTKAELKFQYSVLLREGMSLMSKHCLCSRTLEHEDDADQTCGDARRALLFVLVAYDIMHTHTWE